MLTLEPKCSKCGGVMRKGELHVSVIQAQTQSPSPFMPGGYMGGFPMASGEATENLYWEEKTGEKKGTFFKRDETKKMAFSGYRCTLCGYVELYAIEK